MENINSDLIRGNIDTIILKCLNHGDMYGLEICNHIKQASSGTYILKQPTLYSALKRLEGKGFITSFWRDSSIGGRRHYYKLTDTGRQSFAGRKDQWSVSKEVIDTLVEEKPMPAKSPCGPSKKPSLAADEVTPALPHTVSIGMPISPYNPYADSDEDCLTLPFRIIENGAQAIAPHPGMASNMPEPLNLQNEQIIQSETKADVLQTQILSNYVLADNAVSPVQPVQNLSQQPSAKPAARPSMNTFAKYLSPDDYAAIAAVKTGAAAKTAKIANYDIHIRPFVKHYLDTKRGDYHFIARLRLVAALLITLAVVVGITIVQYRIKPDNDYSSDERLFFILGYAAASVYFAFYLVRFVSNPQAKKVLKTKFSGHFVRLCAFLGAIIAIFSINILAGLTHVNSPDFLVFWAIPCILAAVIYAEGVIQYFLKRTNIFAA